MKIKRFEFNMFPVNCYVLWDDTKEAVVIDPGCFYEEEKQALKKFILTNELTVKHLLNTHLHLDHIFGNPFMLKEFSETEPYVRLPIAGRTGSVGEISA